MDSPGFDGAVAAIDRLVIGGAQTTALTTFGGINTGQHGKFPLFYAFKTLKSVILKRNLLITMISFFIVYLDTARATGTAATITITTVGIAASRTWKIKVRQIIKYH